MLSKPSPQDVLNARLSAGLTQSQAAFLVHLAAVVRWSEYERGVHSMPLALWELFLLRVGLHPTHHLAPHP